MRLVANVTWKNGKSVGKMTKHLLALQYNTSLNLAMIFGASNPSSLRNTEISIRCGVALQRSAFVFVKGAENTSQISGCCSSNRLDHLLDDFKHLKEQMQGLSQEYKLAEPTISLNDEKLVKKSKWGYLRKRSVLADFVTMAGVIPIFSSYVITRVIGLETIIPVLVGTGLWMLVAFFGYRSEPEYVLKD